MHHLLYVSSLALLVTQALGAYKILIVSSEGHGTANARALFDTCTNNPNYNCLLVETLDRDTFTLSIGEDPEVVSWKDVVDGITEGSAPYAVDPTAGDPRIWYVNSNGPGMLKTAIHEIAPRVWGSTHYTPDLVLSGIRYGYSEGKDAVRFSSTVVLARIAMDRYGIPAIAFSGGDSVVKGVSDLRKPNSLAYNMAASAFQLVGTMILSHEVNRDVLLPDEAALNVNISPSYCKSRSFIMTRIAPNPGFWQYDGCCDGTEGKCHLQYEGWLLNEDNPADCRATVTVFDDSLLHPDAGADKEAHVARILKGLITCGREKH